MPARPSLRDTLAAGLATLPNATRLGLTVASSTPKRTTTLFPYASPSSAVRCWETEHLVVVDCGIPATPTPEGEGAPAGPSASGSSDKPTETGTAAGTSNGTGTAAAAPPPPQSVLAAAISVHVYTLPTKDVPTSIVYISKVDSSGYASSAGPLTRELAIGVLTHFLAPETRPTPRVLVTLFARSQGQYLFPNSIEGAGKRVLGGLGLCQWWKAVYEGAARRLVEKGITTPDLKLRYLLPSYSAAEAKGMLRAPVSPPPVPWEYAPPFVSYLLPLQGSLAALIPSLPDDPKTRFLDELAGEALEAVPYTTPATAHASSSTPAPASTDSSAAPPSSPKKRKREAVADEEDRKRTHAALGKVPADEFWERIGFRQECSSGDVTGFFCMAVEPPVDPSIEQKGKEKDKGKDAAKTSNGDEPSGSTSPTAALPLALVERLLKALLNTDFGTRALAADGTQGWLDSARRLIVDEVGEEGWKACIASVDAKVGEVPGERKRKEEVVTVLQVRKRKK